MASQTTANLYGKSLNLDGDNLNTPPLTDNSQIKNILDFLYGETEKEIVRGIVSPLREISERFKKLTSNLVHRHTDPNSRDTPEQHKKQCMIKGYLKSPEFIIPCIYALIFAAKSLYEFLIAPHQFEIEDTLIETIKIVKFSSKYFPLSYEKASSTRYNVHDEDTMIGGKVEVSPSNIEKVIRANVNYNAPYWWNKLYSDLLFHSCVYGLFILVGGIYYKFKSRKAQT